MKLSFRVYGSDMSYCWTGVDVRSIHRIGDIGYYFSVWLDCEQAHAWSYPWTSSLDW